MKIFDIHEASIRLPELAEGAARGVPFIIAKAGVPMVRVTAVCPPLPTGTRRIGFLEGEIKVPDDFDRMGEAEITRQFQDQD